MSLGSGRGAPPSAAEPSLWCEETSDPLLLRRIRATALEMDPRFV